MPPLSAVVADHWPLVRAGLAVGLREAGVLVAAEVDAPDAAPAAVATTGAQLAVLTGSNPAAVLAAVTALAALADRPRIVVLVDTASREDLRAVVEAGADGVLLRTAPPSDVAAAVPRLLAGERVVSPALVGALVGSAGGTPADPAGTGGGPGLTAKELQVLRRLAAGDGNREIGTALFLAPATVKTHLRNIYGKLGVASRQDAVRRAVELGLV